MTEEQKPDYVKMAEKIKEKAYRDGYIDGLESYAYWKDGTQYVGTTGTTLEEAVESIEENWNYSPPRD